MTFDRSFRGLSLVPCLLALAGCSGGVSSGASSGSPSSLYPASAPDNPQVVDLGGPRITSPKVVVFYDPSDDGAATIVSFLMDLGASDYWKETAGEYGIGPITSVEPVPLPSPFPTATSSAEVAAFLAPLATSYLASAPGAGASTIVDGTELRFDTLFAVIPPTAAACSTFDGDHGSMVAGQVTVPWVLAQRCPDSAGLTPVEHTLAIVTHEIVDASTCPFSGAAPAFAGVDANHLAWTTDGAQRISTEVAHLCDSNHIETTVGAEAVTLERVWSNTAAAAGHNRCAPIPSGDGAEVLGVPVLTDQVPFLASQTTLGVALRQGESTTIDVKLISDAPTDGPFYLEAIDVAESEGRPPELTLSLDASSGENGEVVHLTITRLLPPNPSAPVNGVVFRLGASLSPSFGTVHYSRGFVSNGSP
jgi:hypothetical protein